MWRRFRDGAIIVFFTLLFATGMKSCIIDAYKIPTASMSETLVAGDYLLVNKFIYGARTPQKFLYVSLPHVQFPKLSDIHRGDVIVFEFPGEPNEVLPVRNLFLVKRCIGLPSDTIDIVNGSVRINRNSSTILRKASNDFPTTIVPFKGMKINLHSATFAQWKVFIQREGSSVELRRNIILIDGQKSSSYTVKKNYFFALGDNINNSADSRVWGFIPEENIVGKAMMIYWSKNNNGIQWNRIGTLIR
jgi:signal peptidase I